MPAQGSALLSQEQVLGEGLEAGSELSCSREGLGCPEPGMAARPASQLIQALFVCAVSFEAARALGYRNIWW